MRRKKQVIALDTNILVRYFVKDDHKQFVVAKNIIQTASTQKLKIFLSDMVICELVWVLRHGYKVSKDDVVKTLQALFQSEEMQFENITLCKQALSLYEKNKGDFSDYLIGYRARSVKAQTTYTFDKNLSQAEIFTVV